MSAKIPDSHKYLLEEAIPVTIATIMPNGNPQLSVVWCNYDGEHVLLNTARGRQKDKNLLARPTATVLAFDPQNSLRYIEVRGTVVEMTEEGAVEHMNSLAKLYAGVDSYYGGYAPIERQQTETRVLIKLKPTKVNVH